MVLSIGVTEGHAIGVGQVTACSDGIENDGDGAIDHPADPECTPPWDTSERHPGAQCGIGSERAFVRTPPLRLDRSGERREPVERARPYSIGGDPKRLARATYSTGEVDRKGGRAAMSAPHHGAFAVPFFHVHAPHWQWHRVEHPIRAALLAAAVVLTVTAGAVAARAIPAWLAAWEAPARPAVARELPPEWRYERKAVAYEHMYGRHAKAPSVEHMYMKPRAEQR